MRGDLADARKRLAELTGRAEQQDAKLAEATSANEKLGASVRDFLGGVGLGRLADALADLLRASTLRPPVPPAGPI